VAALVCRLVQVRAPPLTQQRRVVVWSRRRGRTVRPIRAVVHGKPSATEVGIAEHAGVLDVGVDGLFDEISRDVVLGLMADSWWDGSIFSPLGVLFTFVLGVVDGFVLASPLFREVESGAKRPGALIGVAISAPSRASVQLIVTWQLSTEVVAPHHWEPTPTLWSPFFGRPMPSTTIAASGPCIESGTVVRSWSWTAEGSQALSQINRSSRSCWEPTREANPVMDLRLPGRSSALKY